MRVSFRADASLHIGTGHVMRCLTLADALAARGVQCHFVCRAHEGHLIDLIRAKGHGVHALPVIHPEEADSPATNAGGAPAHRHWLGATQAQDAEACAPILAALRPDWLIIDHYALDVRWEQALSLYYRKLMVIDDLADRAHACDMLHDQTFGREADDYRPWVPADCQLLCGSRFALLRPEFAALRPYSLQRRRAQLKHLLITLGGVDKNNVTGQVLYALHNCQLPSDCRITVVMGATAPWLADVQAWAQTLRWPTRVLVGVDNMAQLMADSDLAIGAAGATSWERCCLGVPTIMLVLAENQMKVADGLAKAGAVRIIQRIQDIPQLLPSVLFSIALSPTELMSMSEAATQIVDGHGLDTVINLLVC